jgi:hypothetical protein
MLDDAEGVPRGFDSIGDAIKRASGPNPIRIMLAPMSYAETLAAYGDNGVYYKDLPPPKIQKVISGGQTGADRAALDWAIENGIDHGGYCPRGRVAEDGAIPARYNLIETAETEYSVRTKRNVEESDATVIITLTAELTGGSRETAQHARKAGKRWIQLSHADRFDISAALRGFAKAEAVRTFNVAGSREGEEPGIYQFTKDTLKNAFPKEQ